MLWTSYKLNQHLPFDVHQCTWSYRFTPFSFRTSPPSGYVKTVLPLPDPSPRKTVPPMPGTPDYVARTLCCWVYVAVCPRSVRAFLSGVCACVCMCVCVLSH